MILGFLFLTLFNAYYPIPGGNLYYETFTLIGWSLLLIGFLLLLYYRFLGKNMGEGIGRFRNQKK